MNRRHVVGFVVLTWVLVLGSLGWSVHRHRASAPRRDAWREISDRLRAEKSRIDSLEAELVEGRRTIAAHRARLDSLEARLAAFEARAVNGRLPPPAHHTYMSVIEEQNETAEAHNEALARVHQVYAVYADLVRTHNAVIDSANRLRRAAAEEGIRLEDVDLR